MIQKLPLPPKHLFKPGWKITIELPGISEDGGPIIGTVVEPDCWFNAKASYKTDTEKHLIRLSGSLLAIGDLFPEIPHTAKGIAEKGTEKYQIYSIQRPLNPDGSVYATILELI